FCDVNVMSADGSRKRRLLQDIPYLGPVVWSRDSKTIFFTAYLAKPPGGIVRLDVRTGAARVIAPWATNLFLAQDGRTIGFIEEDSGAVVIATLDGHILGKHSLPRGFPDNLDLRVGQS